MTGLPPAPRRFDDVPTWAASLGPDLQPYLAFFGTALVRTAGTPDQLDAAATGWKDSGRLLDEGLQALAHPRGDAATSWRGPAADEFAAEYVPLKVSATALQARIADAADAVTRMATALREAHRKVEEVTTSFLADALRAQQLALATSGSELGAGSAGQYPVRLKTLFETAEPQVTATVKLLDLALAAAAKELSDTCANVDVIPRRRDEIEDASVAAAAASGLGIAPGITRRPGRGRSVIVDRVGADLIVSGKLALVGDAADAATAKTLQDAVTRKWTASFPDGSSIKTDVEITYYPPDHAPPDGVNTITMNKDYQESKKMAQVGAITSAHVDRQTGDTTMALGRGDLADVWAHEFGHVIGLEDAYQVAIRTMDNGEKIVFPYSMAGYDGDVMGSQLTDSRHLSDADLAAQVDTGPAHRDLPQSPRDLHPATLHNLAQLPTGTPDQQGEQALAWLTGHSADAVAPLPVDDRVAAVRTLLTGTVTAQDAAAAEQLLSSIGSPADAVVVQHALQNLPKNIADPAIGSRIRSVLDGL